MFEAVPRSVVVACLASAATTGLSAGARADDLVAPPAAAPTAEVLVVGTQESKTGGSGMIIKTKQLERFEHDDAHQVLLASPGVYVRPEDGFGLRPNIRHARRIA